MHPAIPLPGGPGQLLCQSVALFQRGLQLLQLGFQGGDLAGLVVAAAVELLFQRGGCFGEGYVLLAGGQQRGDTPFQLRIPGDGQADCRMKALRSYTSRVTPSSVSPQF